MKIPSFLERLKAFRFPGEVISYAVLAYYRFALSTADVEDLLAERGVVVSRETVREWVNRFGRHLAHCIKRGSPPAADKWHLDEVVITIKGRQFCEQSMQTATCLIFSFSRAETPSRPSVFYAG